MTAASVDELLQTLSRQGIRVWAEGEAVRFRGPSGTMTSELRERVAANRPELVRRLRDLGAGPGGVPLVPAAGDVRLSFGQERLWFLSQLRPDSAEYGVPLVLRFEGELDLPTLERALQGVVNRHEVLRTAIHTVRGRPRAELLPPDSRLEVEGLDGLEPARRGAEVRRRLERAAVTPIDPACGPLRTRLLRLTAREHLLVLNIHHLAADEWSVGVLLAELAELYGSRREGRAARLPRLAIQYSDFAVWQRRRLEAGELGGHLEHWLSELAGVPQVLDLPTDRPRSAGRASGAGGVRRELAVAADRLRVLGAEVGATLFMTLLAAFQILLHRSTGQPTLMVGTAVSGRGEPALEPLIGFFLNTLALVGDARGDPSVRDYLHRTRRTVLEAFAHQDLPFERLVEELQPERDMARTPLVQAMFGLRQAGGAEPAPPGLRVTRVPVACPTPKLELELAVEERDGRLRAWLEFDAGLHDASTMARLLERFERVLQGMTATPGASVWELDVLTPEDREALAHLNLTAAAVPERCVHRLFEERAHLTPDRPAVIADGGTLRYAELEERANRLAHVLRELGAGPDRVVGLCLERSPALVVGLLGILKSGAAYVALEPGHPLARSARLLTDCDARLVVTLEGLLDQVPAGPVTALCLDRDARLALAPAAPPDVAVRPANLAYVACTSGSTGEPKGVMVEHRQLVNYLVWAAGAYPVADGPVPVHTPVSVDLTVTSLLLPLCTGRSVLLLPEGRGVAALAGQLRKPDAVGLLKLTPTHLRLLSGELAGHVAAAVGVAVVGGEQLTGEAAAAWRAISPTAVLVNEYGPTEATVGCSAHRMYQGDRAAGPLPIGRPIANAQLHVLGPGMVQVPPGAVGELYVGGAGVSRGYLGCPGPTAERFVPDPFGSEPGGRLYRTGDLARLRPDGSLVCLGRTDRQLKILGQRVEPAEIEAALVDYPGVQAAVVTSRGGRLVAYMVAEAGREPRRPELRTHLERLLPEHMVPAAFVRLEALPITASGKVDESRLPDASSASSSGRGSAARPLTETECLLAHVWAEVLELDEVGVDDNFFEVGGDSLRALEATAAMRDALGLELGAQALFESPTISALARRVERGE